jgi:hypothetical protein
MSIQVHCCSGSTSSSMATNNQFLAGQLIGGSQTIAIPLCIPGTFRNWRTTRTVAPGGSATATYTLQKNDIATALVHAYGSADVEKTDTDNVAFAALETIKLVYAQTGTPATAQMRSSIEFVPDTADQILYGFGGSDPSLGHGIAPIGGGQFTALGGSGFIASSLVGVDGTFTHLVMRVRTAPGAGKSRTYCFQLDGVDQDGSGGTVDTRATIADTNTTSPVATFTLPVTAGQVISLVYKSNSGGPAAVTNTVGSCAFVATTPGRYVYSSGATGPNLTGTEYCWPTCSDGTNAQWDGTEANREFIGGMSQDIYLRSMRFSIPVAAGAGKSWTARLRVDETDTDLFVTISGATDTTGALELDDPIVITAANRWSVSLVPVGSPAIGSAHTRITLGFGIDDAIPPALKITQQRVLLLVNRTADPVLVAACTGGGTIAAGSNPAAGSSLAGTAMPLVYLVLQTDAGEKRYGREWIVDSSEVEGRIASISPIRLALSDWLGGWQTGTVTVTLKDTDNVLRGMADSGVLLNKRGDLYFTSRTIIAAAGTPRRRFQGIIQAFRPLGGDLFELSFADFVGSRFSDFDQAKMLPAVTFSTTYFPNIANSATDPVSPGNPAIIGKAVPIGYGSLSDESAGLAAIGVVPAYFVGRRLVNGAVWDEWILFQHAIKFIQSWHAEQTPNPTRVRMELGTEGVDFLIPGYAGYTLHTGSANPYFDVGGQRFTRVLARGPRSDAARENRCPFAFNVCGIETVGDGSGTMIDSLALQILHLINNYVIQKATGNWLTVPTIGSPAYDRIRVASFNTVQAASVVRLAGGYKGAFILGNKGVQQQVGEILRQGCIDGDFDLGLSSQGQIYASMEDSTAAIVKAFTGILDVVEGTFGIDVGLAKLANRFVYRAARRYVEPATKFTPAEGDRLPDRNAPTDPDWLLTPAPVDDATSIAALGGDPLGVKPFEMDFPMVRDAATAANVITRRKARSVNGSKGPVIGSFTTELSGDVELGDKITLEHPKGMAAAPGWIARPLRVLEIAIDANLATETFTAHDLTGL